ncbi:MAG: hypothetical protein CL503_03725 [Actinobacteria bacterium]|nr:hypothetical protein [Actinomycetota bacterium]
MTMNIKWVIICCFLLVSSVYSNINTTQPINDIKFVGLTSSLAQQAVESLTLQTLSNSTASLRQLKADIHTIYQTGYFSEVTINSDIIDDNHILSFYLTENLPINDITVMASSDRLKTIVYTAFSSLLNSPLNSITLERLKQATILSTKQAGFDFFDLSDIIYDKASQSLQITVTEVLIEDITFVGLENIKPAILIREMTQKNDMIFNSLDLRKDRERLIRLGYFNSISSPEFSKGASSNLIKIKFNVVEKKLNKISFGLEQDQLLYYGFVSNRRHNFLINSDLITLKTQVQLEESNIKFDRYAIGYTQPWLFNRYNIGGSLSFYNLEKQEVVNNQTTRSLRQGQKFGIMLPFSDFFSLNSYLKFENISQLFESDNISPYSIHSYEMVMLFETIRNSMDPKQGSRIYFNIEQGNHLGFIKLGGLSFTRLSSSVSYYRSVASNLVLASRLKGGIFYPIQESIYTYEHEYFILGGSRSIRGYNEADSLFSGRRHLLMNLELRYSLSTNFQSVLFVDYGNAFNQRIILADFNLGYGIGLRYHTPIGPIRIDFSQGDPDFYIHFGLGHVF